MNLSVPIKLHDFDLVGTLVENGYTEEVGITNVDEAISTLDKEVGIETI